MNTNAFNSSRLTTLLRVTKSKHRTDVPEPAEPVAQLIRAFLEWNASRPKARGALKRLTEHFVDFNELRVSFPYEVEALLGPNYPTAGERAERLHEALNMLFQREQAVSLESLEPRSKKDVRTYLDTLAGVPPYVAAQVTLLCFHGHAVPVDEQLADLLREHEIVAEDATLEAIESFLQRHIKADQAVETHARLMAWVDAGSRRASLDRGSRTTKKKTTKSTKKKTRATTRQKVQR